MTKIRGALLALALGLVTAACWGGWAFHHAQVRARDEGVGRQDRAHLAAAQAVVAHLTLPKGATRDSYASACRLVTTFCITSTHVSDRALFANVTAQIKATGARQYDTECARDLSVFKSDFVIDCSARFDLHGAHLAVMSGPGAYLSATVSDEAALLASQRRSLALGPWASADPFPNGWISTAVCRQSRADGCHWWRSNDQLYANVSVPRPTITGTVDARMAEARQSMLRHGLVVGPGRCDAATSQEPRTCRLHGFRNRTVGGRDGEQVLLTLQQVDADHVALVGIVAT